MTLHIPDPRDYQQLDPVGRYGGFNCTAEGTAFRVDAHTKGTYRTTGEAVRAHSDEPIPDPDSPGLNLGQTDAAVSRITGGRVDLDTRVQGRSLSRAELRFRVLDDRFCGLSVIRGVLLARGVYPDNANRFAGAHDVTIFPSGEPDVVRLFDPLVPYIVRTTFDAAFDAAEALTPGYRYAQLTRDLTPDYRWVLRPLPGKDLRAFYRFHVVDGKIVRISRHQTAGTNVRCSSPRYFAAATGRPDKWSRFLVSLIVPGSNRDGWLVNADYAEEQEP